MKLGNCTAYNFGSYPELHFDFQDLGLVLVQGPTGAGKSTLFDLAAWCLFGITSKNGTVDEVKSWNADNVTACVLEVYLKGGVQICVRRIRGAAKDNDLYWEDINGEHRGKDIKDTQRLLNERLGVGPLLYQYASYFSEFSPSATFFVANSKGRKQLLDSLTDLSFSSKLQVMAKDEVKNLKSQLQAQERLVNELQYKSRLLLESAESNIKSRNSWSNAQNKLLNQLEDAARSFEKDKENKLQELIRNKKKFEELRLSKMNRLRDELETLRYRQDNLQTEACPTCGADSPNKQEFEELTQQIQICETQLVRLESAVFVDNDKIAIIENSENRYVTDIETEKRRTNPFVQKGEELQAALDYTNNKHTEEQATLYVIEYEQKDLETIIELTDQMSNYLLQKSVSDLRDITNHYLTKYFDGEFVVGFLLEGADDINITIMKNGNLCSYTQLSKGQRGLLKLSFALAVMKVSANNVGIHFDNIFLDESLDGLDSDLKVKALGVLQELASEHSTVMIIDHSTELKNQIDNRITVSLVGDRSVLEQS